LSTGNPTADALKPVIEAVAAGWILQFGLWRDSGSPTDRFVVVQPIGGAGAGRLVRQPLTSVWFVGAINDAPAVLSVVAEAFNAALLVPISGLAYAEGTEPRMLPTAEGRPVAEVIVSSIVSL
jgi:hypothetical protein